MIQTYDAVPAGGDFQTCVRLGNLPGYLSEEFVYTKLLRDFYIVAVQLEHDPTNGTAHGYAVAADREQTEAAVRYLQGQHARGLSRVSAYLDELKEHERFRFLPKYDIVLLDVGPTGSVSAFKIREQLETVTVPAEDGCTANAYQVNRHQALLQLDPRQTDRTVALLSSDALTCGLRLKARTVQFYCNLCRELKPQKEFAIRAKGGHTCMRCAAETETAPKQTSAQQQANEAPCAAHQIDQEIAVLIEAAVSRSGGKANISQIGEVLRRPAIKSAVRRVGGLRAWLQQSEVSADWFRTEHLHNGHVAIQMRKRKRGGGTGPHKQRASRAEIARVKAEPWGERSRQKSGGAQLPILEDRFEPDQSESGVVYDSSKLLLQVQCTGVAGYMAEGANANVAATSGAAPDCSPLSATRGLASAALLAKRRRVVEEAAARQINQQCRPDDEMGVASRTAAE